MKQLKNYILMAAAGIGMMLSGACTDSPDTDPYVFVSMATYESAGDDGSVFTIQEGADTPPISLTSSIVLPKVTYPVGCRLLLAYTNEANDPYAPGEINLVDYGPVINGTLAITENGQHVSYEFDMLQVWRTGTYINMAVTLYYKTNYESFGLEVDAESLDNPIPDIYVTYMPDTQNDALGVGHYASIDIAEVWNRPGVEGVRLRYVGGGLGPTTIMKE